MGREEIWKRVQGVATDQVVKEIIKTAKPGPLMPPTAEIVNKPSEHLLTIDDLPDLIINVSYYLPPASPEEIERDLLQSGRTISENSPETIDTIKRAQTCQPPDPREAIPGAGILKDTGLPDGIDAEKQIQFPNPDSLDIEID